MNGQTTMNLALQAPTTVDELHFIEGLSENVIKEYGERLVKNINSFVELNELQEYLDKRPKKRPRAAAPTGDGKKKAVPKAPAIIDVDDEEDEFPCAIDFTTIEDPTDCKASSKSPYF